MLSADCRNSSEKLMRFILSLRNVSNHAMENDFPGIVEP